MLLGVTLCVPFLEIDDWLLTDRPLSIVTAVAGLWATGAYTLAIVVATFLGLVPIAAGVLTLILLLCVHRSRASARWRRALTSLRRGEMLDGQWWFRLHQHRNRRSAGLVAPVAQGRVADLTCSLLPLAFQNSPTDVCIHTHSPIGYERKRSPVPGS